MNTERELNIDELDAVSGGADELRELRDNELALVSGGALYTHFDQLEGGITTNGFSSWTELYTFRFGW